ncbi:tetratricopeptide repeat protein [Bacillus gaemokensis]|uniref:Histidine kinase n=1 Tax=Bacillus gaemokensis TaxID=574375 RepID=A0A073KNK6_9BACI|nr:tetratricopeptide repeat protein [Bacillus gaemokensis]KEK23928.1 histidine kinase [Bacillus gaemokensis]KYG38050.1 histidine kinase [Bacillus gaemokensis]
MNVSVKGNEQITNLLNDWYVEIRSRNINSAHRLKLEIDKKIDDVENDQYLLLYYSLLDFRYQYVIDNLGVSENSFDKIESFEIPTDSFLSYYYHFFKAIHASGIGNYMIAREHFDKAELLLETIPDEVEKAEFYYKLGAFHFDICESLQSFKYTTKAKEMFLQQGNYERNIGFCENLLGMSCVRLNEWALAEEHLVKAMDIFQKLKEDTYILMVRHNLGFMYSSQNLSELAIRYLSEVTSQNPRHIKALYLESKERYKLNELNIAEELANKGHSICCELGNIEYRHHFSILRNLIKDTSAEELETVVLEGVSYFKDEELYDYIQENQEYLATKFYKEDNHLKASKYFYLSSQARHKSKEREALK